MPSAGFATKPSAGDFRRKNIFDAPLDKVKSLYNFEAQSTF
jgi:hypothetical protein